MHSLLSGICGHYAKLQKTRDHAAFPIIELSLFNSYQNQKKKNLREYQTTEPLNTFWGLLASNAAKGWCMGFLAVEIPSTILDSCITLTCTVGNAQEIVHNFLTFAPSSECFFGTCEIQDCFFYILSELNFWWQVGIQAFSDTSILAINHLDPLKKTFFPQKYLEPSLLEFFYLCVLEVRQ